MSHATYEDKLHARIDREESARTVFSLLMARHAGVTHRRQYRVGEYGWIAPILQEYRAWAAAEIERASCHGIRILGLYDDDYPVALRNIPNPPTVLYVRGTLREPCMAVVGTREPTEFGLRVASSATTFLCSRGYSIVSGLALGIDTEAHKAALEAGGHTIAVMASGLDTVYPASNQGLAARILESGGAWVSETAMGQGVSPQRLAARNRIQSGLSRGTLVCQSALDGGTMHTAKFSRDQGRPVYVPVPHGVHSNPRVSQGLLALLKAGAIGLESRDNYPRMVDDGS